MKLRFLFIIALLCQLVLAQNTLSGVVTTHKDEPIVKASITLVNESITVFSDANGQFSIKRNLKFPLELKVSCIGFKSKTIRINGFSATIILEEEDKNLDEIVVSASRTPERVKESPVTIERMSIKEIKKTASPTFYDGLENLKEVHMNTSSMSFKSINTRGFATVANTRFMQLVDGMDNSSPLLNFVLGNLLGVSEVDVANVELLPGASSALYGANAFNGILFMNSKSPFTHQGITPYIKLGQTSQKAAGNNLYYDFGIRMSKAFTKHFAAKANITFMEGTDWYANDTKDYTNFARTRTNPDYNGLNVFGDEVSTNLKDVGPALVAAGVITPAQAAFLPNQIVSRTGYNETDLTDNKVQNSKIDYSLHFKPWNNDTEIILQSKFGFGNTVYQGANRYYLNNFFMQQHKLEVKGKNFFVRGYTTTEDGGNSYDMLFTGININRLWKSDTNWFGQYAGAYLSAFAASGGNQNTAHAAARAFADTGRFLPGTPAFKSAFNAVTSNPDVLKGSRLQDNSTIWHSDANYNLKDIIKYGEFQIGGSYRLYELNSGGRIYTDANGQINYTDYGAYVQWQKKFLDDKLKLTSSIRYDKSQNFEGNYSPRISLVYAADQARNHNFRASFQTGFRNPTTQDQYIGFNVGNAILLGSAPDNLTRYSETLPVSVNGQAFTGGASTVTINGFNAYKNSYTASSAAAFGAAVAAAAPTNAGQLAAAIVANSSLLRKTNVDFVKPETVKAIELGYRGQTDDFSYDINGYYNIYNDFIGNLTVVAPLYGTVANGGSAFTPPNPAFQSAFALTQGDRRAFQLYTNTSVEIRSMGIGIGLNKKINEKFDLSGNYNYAQFDFDQAKDPSFEAGFNTPKHRAKIAFSGDNIIKNLGFNIAGRWNSSYKYEANFADGMIEAATVIDAQISYGIPQLKSILKIGATNIGGKEYRQIIGAGLIGQQYFASLTINP